jgi:hypothetical protein
VPGAAGARMLVPVSDRRVHIAIDASVAEDQIHGNVSDGEGEPRQFAGWLALIGELDGMLGSRDSAQEEPQ